MIEIKINGETETIKKSISISDLLTEKSVKMPDMVSVEYNGDMLDRDQFDSVMVNQGDEIEFLYFMGGG